MRAPPITPWEWVNTFCADRGAETDTFNLAFQRKLIGVTHDVDTSESRAFITDAGRERGA